MNITDYRNFALSQVMLDTDDIGVIVLDKNGIIQECNKGMFTVFGYGREELVGVDHKDFFNINNEKGIPDYGFELARTGRKFSIETSLLTKSKHTLWVNLGLRSINFDNKLIGYVLLLQDISEKDKKEKVTQDIAKFPNENPYPILRISREGKVLFSNNASAPLIDTLKCDLEGYVDKSMRVIVEEVLKKNRPRNIDISYKEQCFLFSVVPVTEYVNLYGIDITDRKKMEDDLKIAKEKAEESDRLKSEFLAQISHEIRTPLNAVVSYVSLLEDELENNPSEDVSIAIDGINSGSRRLIRTIDLILNVAQLNTGKYKVDFDFFDLRKNVIDKISSEFKSTAKEKGLSVNIDDRIADTSIYGDLYSVTQIFTNLIDNAVKYTQQGSVNISFDQDEFGRIKVKVSDTGIGIEEKNLSKIFEPFFQEDSGYTRSHEGNGLGLTLVKEYCKLNNALITLESEKGKGSTFCVTFPSVKEQHQSIGR